MICVPVKAIELRAKTLPISYLDDCKSRATVLNGKWCFSKEDYEGLRQKYRGYAVTEADRFREGEIISGCCDRADQY